MMKVWPCAGTAVLKVFFHGAIIKSLYSEIVCGMKAGEYGAIMVNRTESIRREGAGSVTFPIGTCEIRIKNETGPSISMKSRAIWVRCGTGRKGNARGPTREHYYLSLPGSGKSVL